MKQTRKGSDVGAAGLWFTLTLLALGLFSHLPDTKVAESMTTGSIQFFLFAFAFAAAFSVVMLIKSVVSNG